MQKFTEKQILEFENALKQKSNDKYRQYCENEKNWSLWLDYLEKKEERRNKK